MVDCKAENKQKETKNVKILRLNFLILILFCLFIQLELTKTIRGGWIAKKFKWPL